MKVADYIAQRLEQRGISAVFELSGGMIAHLLDALCRQGKVRVISMHHEQGAAFAAEGFSRLTGIPGVALATSGPGATNLLTGIGSCYFDSSPALFITGQVNRSEQKGRRPIRQLGFQETDIVAMAEPITKAAWRVTCVEEVAPLLERALSLATCGRPGPVLLDVPMDIQGAEMPKAQLEPVSAREPELPRWDKTFWSTLAGQLQSAQRPLILAGGGIRAGGAVAAFRSFAQRMGIPVVHSLMGVDVLPYTDPLRVGLIGSYGNRWANWALGLADWVLVLGSRLDIRQTGSETQSFKGQRTIIHVDCEPGEINNRVTGCEPVVGELRHFLSTATKELAGIGLQAIDSWKAAIASKRAEWPDTQETASSPGINPNAFMHALSQVSGGAGGYVVDVGQHQMWAAQSLEVNAQQRFLTSGGMGSMGFALPTAIGAAMARPGEPWVVVAGDGGFQCNIQELQTVVRNKLPLKIVVLNNQSHGMVRQFQQSYFGSRYQSTLWGYSAPDFLKVAKAYGIPARRVAAPAGVQGALRWLWREPEGAALLDVRIDTSVNVYPKMAFGHPITEMEPFVSPIQMEGT